MNAGAGHLTWTATANGRYPVLARPGDDGQVRSTSSPADQARPTHQLGELIESMAPRALAITARDEW